MGQKIHWIESVRGIACVMVIMIHTTTWYITNAAKVSPLVWDIADLLNSASRMSVPLFFMISGYLFFGERSAQARHFLRIVLCLVFYNAVALLYIGIFTRINPWQSFIHILQRPVFYHLWFFYGIMVLYLLSPLITVRQISARKVLLLSLVLGVLANPNLVPISRWHIPLLPVDLYIQGDVFYYLLYGILGRAIGTLNTERPWITLAVAAGFVLCVTGIAHGTQHALLTRGTFSDIWYIYSSPLVLLAALCLFVLIKNTLHRAPVPGLTTLSRYSLGIYGFHAFIIHYLRNHTTTMLTHPLWDLVGVFSLTLGGSLALAAALRWVDRKRLVS